MPFTAIRPVKVRMSDFIKHECGIALIRLLKPLDYYREKYKTPLYGLNQLILLMEKQHNRGQDGAGIGSAKLNIPPGQSFLFRKRSIESNPIFSLLNEALEEYNLKVSKKIIDPDSSISIKEHFDFGGEILMGHLRYGTSGKYDQKTCHPYFHRSIRKQTNFMLLGNFNLTNTEWLSQKMTARGQHPIFDTDTQTILEEVGYFLDEAYHSTIKAQQQLADYQTDIPNITQASFDLAKVLGKASEDWDGGYVIAGAVGNGDIFVMRDPWAIRPCYYVKNEEVVAFASERAPLMTIFEYSDAEPQEVKPGHVFIIKADGAISEPCIREPVVLEKRRECSFERIYFSRGNDAAIYQERKALGLSLVPQILKHIDNDLAHTVFSYIPNTAEIAYYGLMEGLRLDRRQKVKEAIFKAHTDGVLTNDLLDEVILDNWPRGEKVAHKDIKLRTFISQEKQRGKLASHVYDVTYGLIQPEDCLVVLDDSIVRGTTLRESILRILMRIGPRKIIVASTAPQIRYPDCYGIDMSNLVQFIAFQAAISLLKKRGKEDLIKDVYKKCRSQEKQPYHVLKNHVKAIYAPFTVDEISLEIANLVYPKNGNGHRSEIIIMFQSIEDLHTAMPGHKGDWYFNGDYPTPGGYAVLNKAFINYYENKDGRSYP